MSAILAGVVGFALGFLFGFTITMVFRLEENNADDGENDEHLRG